MSGGDKWDKALDEMTERMYAAAALCHPSQAKENMKVVLRERLEPLLDVLENSLSDPWDVHDKILKEISKWKT